MPLFSEDNGCHDPCNTKKRNDEGYDAEDVY